MNPHINCQNLIIGKNVCVDNKKNGCLNYTVLANNHGESCETLSDKYGLSVYSFKSINNALDCSLVEKLNTFCISKYSPPCLEIYQVKANETILSILKSDITDKTSIEKANPYLDLDNLFEDQIICLKEKKNDMEIHLTDIKSNEFSKFLSTNKNIKLKLDAFLKSPDGEKSDALQNELIQTMTEDSVFRQDLKNFENNFATEELKKNGLNKLCDIVKDDENYPKTKSCACENNEPKTYCGILLIQETDKIVLE